ncbi:hypothetical protein HEP81_06525 [Streptomyces griseofuscus]|uniref:Uncharacterized protein n=1 Tax=Streptomyces griseofuscus TaxID=146922 RepID=A0A7H1Q8Y0_9ACTN|nr:hypothetical protein [Streptomyces griseofuscus]QNT96760.1 hypothetical protein HEP81_06525 [Streptomyces griseofuscus]
MFKFTGRRRAFHQHQRLMRVAFKVVSRHATCGGPDTASTAEIVALAFGEHQMRITDAEALDYLNAALADRGYPLRPVAPQAGGEDQ